jgi:hypothetical protein
LGGGRVAATNFSRRANFCVPSFYPTAIFCFHFSRFNNISEFFSHFLLILVVLKFFPKFSIYGSSRSNRNQIIADKDEKEFIYLFIYFSICKDHLHLQIGFRFEDSTFNNKIILYIFQNIL